MPYIEWVKNSFRKLERDFLSGSFKPQNESTINAHLYHHMLDTLQDKPDKDLLLITDWHTKEREKRRFIDLAIVRVKKRREKKEEEPLLLVEIKEAGTNPGPEGVMTRIQEDVDKLIDVMRNKGKTNTERPIMIFFYRETYPKGMSKEDEEKLEEMSRARWRGKNIDFLFGPRKESTN